MIALDPRPRPRRLPRIDWIVIGLTVALSVVGILTMWGASSYGNEPTPFAGLVRRQSQWLLMGLAIAIALMGIDYRWSKFLAWPLYAVLIAVLVALLVRGDRIHGAASWYVIDLGFYRFQFQPSEMGKVIVVMLLARYLSNRMLGFRSFGHAVIPLLLVALPVALIARQPDLGTAMVFVPVGCVMIFVAGLRKRTLLIFMMLAVTGAILGYPHLKDYQKARFETFLNPTEDEQGKSYNINQAQMALGSGRMLGKGWGRGTQTSLRFLPEYQTDFVFPSLGEQFGFVGCIGVLALFGLLLTRIAYVAGSTEDLYGALLVSGFGMILAVHVVLNVGMSTGLMPVTGLPLPFFSYGGSFTLTCYTMIGLIASVGIRRRR